MELETLKTIQLVTGSICLTMFALFVSSAPLMFLESVSDDFDRKLMDFIKITTSVAIFSFILWIISTASIMDKNKENYERETVKRNHSAIRTTYNFYDFSSIDLYGNRIHIS